MTATLAAPDRTLEQRFAALAKANDVRSKRAELKRDLKAGRQLVVPILADPAAELQSMKVLDLLCAVPKVGSVKALGFLREVGVSPSRSVGGLSARQRVCLGRLVAPRDVATLARLRAGRRL